jgi:glycosyltransferase involved in cell wall biosynthesis
MRALLRPRFDVARAAWRPPEDAVPLADDPLSFAAVARQPRSVVTLHYQTSLDARALGRFALRDVQDLRAEAYAAKKARLVLAYSERIASRVGGTFVPIAYPFPERPLQPSADPVAAMVADWRWPPNQVALGDLLAAFDQVRDRSPTARLLLAGRGLDQVGPLAGVKVLGEVASVSEVLSMAALVAFPCPPTSGPKVKVLEALSHGIPVVTTAAGIEGVVGASRGAVVTTTTRFADDLGALLADPERRAALGRAGRGAVLEAHAPRPAARARIEACAPVMPASRGLSAGAPGSSPWRGDGL